jgi:hypothetical protein
MATMAMVRRRLLVAALSVAGATLAPAAVASTPGSPFGSYDLIAATPTNGIQVAGWAIDPDTAAPTTVTFTLDGGTLATVLANVDRPDVGAAFPAYGPYHGFNSTYTVTPGNHTVCDTANNVPGTPGTSTLLGCRNIYVTGDPFGTFDALTSPGSGKITLAGWSIDPDTTQPIAVAFTLDGVALGRVKAKVDRPDVGAAFPAYGPYHGFNKTYTVGPGTHTVCVTAVNVGPGEAMTIGCHSIVVTS